MGLWLKANRTAAEAIAAAVLLLIGVALFMWHDHRVAAAATVKCEDAVSTPQAVATLQGQLDDKDFEITRLKAAQDERNALALIPLRAVTRPVWVCAAGALRAGQADSGAGTQNDRAPSGAGTAVDGARFDARPAIEAYKRRYETVIADARAALAECPTVTVEPLP